MTQTNTKTDDKIDRLLRRPEVETVTGISRSTLYAAMKDGTFPAPVRLGPRTVAWRQSEIEEWVRSRPRAVYS